MSGGQNLAQLERRSSSARLLNLAALSAQLKTTGVDTAGPAAPILVSPRLRSVLIVKERLAGGQAHEGRRAIRSATKVVLPFANAHLNLGGWSLVIGEHEWRAKLAAICGDSGCAKSDIDTLELLAELPSLDPFLVREALRTAGLPYREECLQLSHADASRMHGFVRDQIKRLIVLAYGDGAANDRLSDKLVDVLLTSTADERLEPLRELLKLEPDTYREGLFAWVGFLYYKWSLNELWTPLKESLDQLAAVRPFGTQDGVVLKEIASAKLVIRDSVRRHVLEVRRDLGEYDRVFETVTTAESATVFRDFLLAAPSMFRSLGERTGLLSEFVHAWGERGPQGQRLTMEAGVLLDLLKQIDLELT